MAEDQGLLELQNAALDDWVPESILYDYASKVLRDCRTLLTNLDVYKTVLRRSSPDGHQKQPQRHAAQQAVA